uniref:chitinase n=1 Tax=Culicoides sonorensis TaxID=179676 RepID=A0A336MJW6_CULSO
MIVISKDLEKRIIFYPRHDLREEFEREASKTGRSRLLLTMAVPAGTNHIEKGYNIPKLNKNLDWFNLLSYDFHASDEPQVNHHAPLYSLEEESEYNYDTELNIDYSINYYLKAGADPDKIVLGIPTYGRSYTLANPESTDIGAPAEEPGEKGEFTKEKGYLAYYEICQRIKDEDWNVVDVDPNAVGPYAYKDDQWVGYDDDAIARKKAEYVVSRGLGGIMFWSIDNDDFRGDCHGKPFPIIEAAKEALLNALGISEISFDEDDAYVKPKSKGVVRQKPTKPSKLDTSDLKVGVVESGKPTPFKANPTTRIRQQSNVRSTPSSVNIKTKTTPEPPTTPSSEGDFRCEDEGFFAHPKDCKKYFWCLDGGASGLGLVAHQFTCPSGLYFNPAADSCDYTRNVACKKSTTTTTTTTTTEAPSSTTQRSTFANIVRATSPRTSIFRTTSTTTTTTSTTPASINLEQEETDGEEDPQIIKELISLIKKAGGLEQLEKHFNFNAEDSSGEKEQLSADPTTSTINKNKSLYQRVLNKALALNLNRRDKNEYKSIVRSTTPTSSYSESQRSTTTTTTVRPVQKEYSSRNSRPRPQNDGIDQLPEFENTFKEKPKYVTLVRNRAPNLSDYNKRDNDENDPVSLENQSKELSNSDILETTSRIRYVDVNVLRSLDRSRQKEVIKVDEETERPSTGFSYSTINRQRTRTTAEPSVETVPESSTSKYKTIERSRPSTSESPLEPEGPDRGFGDSRYRAIGEDDDDSDEFPETEIITVKPLQYSTISRGTDKDFEEAKTEFPTEITESQDEYETVNPKVSETIFIVTKPFTETPPPSTQTVSSTTRQSTTTVTEKQTTPSRTTTTRRRLTRPSSRRPSQETEEPPASVRPTNTRSRPSFRQASRTTARPQLLTEEEYPDIQSSTVYAPRPFSSTRNRFSTNEINNQDFEYQTNRPTNVRSSSRGTARFTIPTINVLRNANFKNNVNNQYIRRGPSKAFAQNDEKTAEVEEEELPSLVPSQAPSQRTRATRTRTTRRPFTTVQSTRDSTVVTKDDEPISIKNFLVPDRAINPNNRFTLGAKFGTGRSTARPIVDEVFDIDTANPNLSTSPKAFSYVSTGFGFPTKVPVTPFPNKADINEDTVILTLGGQLAVASAAQNSLQQRINDELAKISSGTVSEVDDDDSLDTVAPYSVTIADLQTETANDQDSFLGIQNRQTTDAVVPTTLRPSRFRSTTQVKTTEAPETVETSSRSQNVRRRLISRKKVSPSEAPIAREESTVRPSRRPSNIYDRTRPTTTTQSTTIESSTSALTTLIYEEEDEQITQTVARLLSTGVPSKYTQQDYTTISESFTTEAIPTTKLEKEVRGTTQREFVTTVTPTTIEASSSPRSRRIKKIRVTRPSTVEPETKSANNDVSTRRRIAVTRSRTTTEAPSTTISSATTPSSRIQQTRSRSRGTIKRLVKKRPITTTRTTPYDEEQEELYNEDIDLDINLDNNIQKQSTSRFADPSEVSRPTRRFQVSRERNELASKNDVQEEAKEVRRPLYATRTPITRARVVPSRTTEAPVSEEIVDNNQDFERDEYLENESDGILDDDDFTVSNKEILSSIGISRPTTPVRPLAANRPSLRPASRFSVRPRPATDNTENQKESISSNRPNQEERKTTKRPAGYRQKSNRPSFGRTSTSTTEAPLLATRSKNANIFQRNRVRNYPGKLKSPSDEKKDDENEIEAITVSSLNQETKSDEDENLQTTLTDETGNTFTITDGKLTTLKGKRPFETTRIETTTTPRATTLFHVFALDENELTTPKPTDPSEHAEEISKRFEKLVEINVIEEINTRTEKLKYNKKANQPSRNNSSEIILEKLPTNHKVGEISRLAVIKLMHGTTESDEVKKSRILSSDAVFKVETSTIPLERLFELEREAKEIRELVPSTTILPSSSEEPITPAYLVTNTQSTETKSTEFESKTESPVSTTTISTTSSTATETPDEKTTQKPLPSLLSLLRPDDKDPLVISIANLDKVTLQKGEPAPSEPSITTGYSSSTTN